MLIVNSGRVTNCKNLDDYSLIMYIALPKKQVALTASNIYDMTIQLQAYTILRQQSEDRSNYVFVSHDIIIEQLVSKAFQGIVAEPSYI